MMITSYFKTLLGNTFFFNDRSVEDTTRAFDLARAEGGSLTVFRVPFVSGPWDRVDLVGHRSRGAIVFDLKRTANPERRFWLEEELRMLDREYVSAGRAVNAAQVAA